MSIQLSYIEELQGLRAAVRELTRENARLKAGGCRFNCRTQKEAFMAGHYFATEIGCLTKEQAFENWKENNK